MIAGKIIKTYGRYMSRSSNSIVDFEDLLQKLKIKNQLYCVMEKRNQFTMKEAVFKLKKKH